MATQTAGQVVQARVDSEKLAKMKADSKKALERVLKQDPAETAKRLRDVKARVAELDNITDKAERDVREAIMKADLKSVRELNKADEQDLASVVFGVKALIDDMGVELKDLKATTPEEQKVLAEAEARLAEARASLVAAQKSWFGKQTKIATAEAAIKACEQGIETAKSQINMMRRQRVLSATLEASLQELIRMNEAATDILRARKEILEKTLEATILNKNEAYKIKEAKAKEVSECEEKAKALDAEVSSLESELEDKIPGTDDYVQLEQTLSGKRIDLDKINIQKKAALAVYNSKEKAIAEQEIDIRTQQKQIGNEQCLIELADSDTKELLVSMRNRLESMKAATEEEASKVLGQLGVEAGIRNAEAMAEFGALSDENMLEVFEKHGDHMKRIAVAQGAQAEKHAEVMKRYAKVYEQFKDNYGIDPLRWSTGGSEGTSEGEPTDSQS